jgi:hypothetical protein
MRSILLGCLLVSLTMSGPAASAATKAPPAARRAGRASTSAIQERADLFLQLVNAGYQSLVRVSQEAQWLADTDCGG